MKIKNTLFITISALAAFASSAMAADPIVVYKGSGDASDIANYYYLTKGQAYNSNAMALYPSDYTGDTYPIKGDGGAYGVIGEMPADFDLSTAVICYMRYEVGVVDGADSSNITFSSKYNESTGKTSYFVNAKDYGKVEFKENFSAKKIISRSFWNASRCFVIGSKDSAETTFSVETSFETYYTTGTGFKVAADAVNNVNNLEFGTFKLAGCKDVIIGEKTGFFDNVTIGELNIGSNSSVIICADKFTAGTADMTSNSDDSLGITFVISEDALAGEGAVFSFDTLKKDAGAKLTLDFSVVDLTKDDAGVYDIIEIGTLEGFDVSSLNDLIVSGLEEKDFASLAWNGNTIQLTVVPEPSTVAAIFGVFALAFVAYRRRK